MTVFRQAPVRARNGEVGYGNENLTHEPVDTGSRIVMLCSTDDGKTWNRDSRVVVDASNGSQNLNLAMFSQTPCGELVINNFRWSMITI